MPLYRTGISPSWCWSPFYRLGPTDKLLSPLENYKGCACLLLWRKRTHSGYRLLPSRVNNGLQLWEVTVIKLGLNFNSSMKQPGTNCLAVPFPLALTH